MISLVNKTTVCTYVIYLLGLFSPDITEWETQNMTSHSILRMGDSKYYTTLPLRIGDPKYDVLISNNK